MRIDLHDVTTHRSSCFSGTSALPNKVPDQAKSTPTLLQASSGKDTLRASRDAQKNVFNIHFADSALTSRAAARGTVVLNDVEIRLDDNARSALQKADAQAQEMREKAYAKYVQEHDAAVAAQQAEVLTHALTSDDFEHTLAGFLLKQHPHPGILAYEQSQSGVDWSQFEWKTYEATMTVRLESSGAEIQGFSVQERTLQSPE